MSYSHSVETKRGKERWFRCDVTGELIHESWPRFHVDGTDIDISAEAVQVQLAPWDAKVAPVTFDVLVADLKERAGITGGHKRRRVPKWVREKTMISSGGACAKCGSEESLQIDHIRPVSKGGSNSHKNLQVLCRRCNIKKGAMRNSSFMAQQ